ncbi:complement C1q tumor necrosis factor-related protein 6-like [Mytilus edulis]|uniref:complement C1q tumor necrosis factor-related protein 6-like n=1 Tax=Mytilus edulis TaxID=6550 RepID=UPI0039EE600B
MTAMSAVCLILVVLVMDCYGHKADSASYTLKIENASFENLHSMFMKINGTEKGLRKHNKVFSAFAASLTASKIFGTGEVVKFNKVWTNVNNDYDPNTGVYTAPEPGVYQFSCSVMAQNNKQLRVYLWKNNERTVAIHAGYASYNMGTLNMILDLVKGDKVYIKQQVERQTYIYSEPTSNFNMFSGYLIR